ncbi:MAG: hypothetical protein JJE51_13590 [Thermoanaerobaculia bacterium]|nr:hypothetical protein [Thermoanaerobaculia bacterium]
MRLTALVSLAALLTAGSAGADIFGCSHSAPRRLTTPVAGVTKIFVTARAGSLRVSGRSGIADVVASGTACASDLDYLKEIQLEARRKGSELHIEALIPERTMIFGWWEARLDFEVVLPAGVPVSVTDGSGSAIIEGTGALEVTDGSGSLEIRNIGGALSVLDGSGEIDIRDVAGDVTLSDGSGQISIDKVSGSVRITEDGSGSIDIRNVLRNVTIDDDGSGSIDVADVRGDFTVDTDGSGGIDHARVGGKVKVPAGKS